MRKRCLTGVLLVLCAAARAADPPGDKPVSQRIPVGPTPIPFKTGNLSVDLLMAVARHQPRPKPQAHPEFDEYSRLGSIRTVEDYLCWLPLEPRPGELHWETYDRHAAELEARGMRYALYPWLHFAPRWVRESDLWDPLVDLAGHTTYAPSIWSPHTRDLFERFYKTLGDHFGERVKEVFVSMVTDYGEVGYPIGMADWVVPAPYKGAGWWCGDRHARADFAASMLAAHGGLAGLNARWGTAWQRPEQVGYPDTVATEGPAPAALQALPPAQRAQARRRWLDFAQWYLDAMVEFTGTAVAISKRHFPHAPHEVKIGFGSERVMFGADYTHYLARANADGYTVRSTHGKLPMFFYRRFSTAARHYGTRLVTEPPAQVSRDEEVERIYKDATSGTSEYFDYPGNVLGATDLFARYARYLEGQHALTHVAFLFPTTDHHLRPGQSLPARLLDVCAASCELFDWDLLDERLVRDGALARYRTLLVPEGHVFEADVLDRLRTWVAAGGRLLAVDQGGWETVEGAPVDLFAQRAGLPTWRELAPAQAQPLPGWHLTVGQPGDEALLTGDWSFRESGHWEWGGEPNRIGKRWTGGHSGVLLPVDPGAEYELAVAVALHPKRLAAAGRVRVNGQLVGDLAPQRTSVFRAKLGPAQWQGRAVSELLFDVEPWRPAELDHSNDGRTLGLAVRWVKLWRAGTPEPDGGSVPAVTHVFDRDALARCVRRVGAGETLLLPGDCPSAARNADLLAELLTGRPTVRDGVWQALLPKRILLYNSTTEPRTRQVRLDPGELAALGAAAPAVARTVAVTLGPRSLGSVELPGGEVVTP